MPAEGNAVGARPPFSTRGQSGDGLCTRLRITHSQCLPRAAACRRGMATYLVDTQHLETWTQVVPPHRQPRMQIDDAVRRASCTASWLPAEGGEPAWCAAPVINISTRPTASPVEKRVSSISGGVPPANQEGSGAVMFPAGYESWFPLLLAGLPIALEHHHPPN